MSKTKSIKIEADLELTLSLACLRFLSLSGKSEDDLENLLFFHELTTVTGLVVEYMLFCRRTQSAGFLDYKKNIL